jgi:hypothetical protein
MVCYLLLKISNTTVNNCVSVSQAQLIVTINESARKGTREIVEINPHPTLVVEA